MGKDNFIWQIFSETLIFQACFLILLNHFHPFRYTFDNFVNFFSQIIINCFTNLCRKLLQCFMCNVLHYSIILYLSFHKVQKVFHRVNIITSSWYNYLCSPKLLHQLPCCFTVLTWVPLLQKHFSYGIIASPRHFWEFIFNKVCKIQAICCFIQFTNDISTFVGDSYNKMWHLTTTTFTVSLQAVTRFLPFSAFWFSRLC